MANNSFVEHVNALANASALATGDIVKDTQEARDIAIQAAIDAEIAEANALNSEQLAHDWADKAHNSPVTGTTSGNDAKFSSYHWAVESSVNTEVSRLQIIRDGITSSTYTWSSQYISDELAQKSNIAHDHAGVYEPVFSKGTAFNKNFSIASGTAGSLETVARSDHNHSGIYEPKIPTYGTAFNKDFGTTSGTVMQGDANFDNKYMPLAVINSAYNKSFVADLSNPTADEVPRGNHEHSAERITYDNSGSSIGSSTAQGAISELSGKMDNITVAEVSYMTALGDINSAFSVSGSDTPTLVNILIPTVQNAQHASLANGYSRIVVSYDDANRSDKLVEGMFAATVTISSSEEYAINLGVDNVVVGERVRLHGPCTLTISQFVTNLNVTGINSAPTSAELQVYLTNLTSAADIDIESINMVWSGSPQGALVASGISIDHSDLTGTGAANGVHTTSDIQGLDTKLNLRSSKIVAPVTDNLLAMDANGDLKDSGVSLIAANNHMDKVASPSLDRIVVMDSSGQSKLGTNTIAELALEAGSAVIPFKVAASTADNEAVNQGQMNAIAVTYVLDVDYQAFIARTDNPHTVTYTQAGAAPLVHSHIISDTAGLQDGLNGKYNLVSTPVSGNIVIFGAGDVLEDSGQILSNIMDKTIYDTNDNGIVDNAEKLNGFTATDFETAYLAARG